MESSVHFLFNDMATPTTEIYTLSLHDALPISAATFVLAGCVTAGSSDGEDQNDRSEEHTSELQSRGHLVCRLMLEKKKICQSKNKIYTYHIIDTIKLTSDICIRL